MKMNFRFVIVFCCSLACIFSFFSCKPQKNTESFNAMNTFMTIQAYGSKSKEALSAVKNRVDELEKELSTTLIGSDIHTLNDSNGNAVSIHNDTAFLFNFTQGLYKATEGALNPALYPVISAWGFTTGDYMVPAESEIQELLLKTDFSKAQLIQNSDTQKLKLEPGMKLDFGAVGKGYAGDEIVRILQQYGVKYALLDLGGNVQTLGTKPDGSLWTVGIKNPWGGDAVCSVKIANKAVVTSGGYERYFTGDDGKKYIHIFDSTTGHPCESDLESVSIVCEEGLYADALSTSLFVMGKDKSIEWWGENGGFDFILITKESELYYSSGLIDSIQVLYPFNAVYVVNL